MKISKKLRYLVFILLCSFPMLVCAKSYYGVISGTEVRIRTSPSGSIIKYVSTGATFEMPDNSIAEKTSNCPNGWYKVLYDGINTGYVCSDYLIVYERNESVDTGVPANECEQQMQQAGFPSNYWTGLCGLKNAHPNWDFKAVTGANGEVVDFEMSVSSESCRNTISSGAQDNFKTNCSGSVDSGYSHASLEAVRYYMNPTNFFTEKTIFMFEGQNVNNSISNDSYKEAATKIFKNNYLIQQIPNLPNYIATASSTTNVSQIALATRIYQELGSANLGYTYPVDNSALYSVVSGNYTTRTGNYYNKDANKFEKNSAYNSVDNYYNFYNIAAYDGSGVTQKALAYAFNHGWGGTGNQDQDRQTSVTGGATFLNNKYFSVGQNTIYFQKFNIYPTTITSRYLNQYMTNIQAPVSESSIAYDAYKSAGLLESSFTFYIPVFSGIGQSSQHASDGSSDGANQSVSASTLITSVGLKNDNGYLANINPGTSAEDIKNSLTSVGGNVFITDASGNAVNGKIGTGNKVKINNEEFTVVIYGDVSGDGQINALDLLKIQKDILKTASLNGAYKSAADTSHDGQVNALDLLKVQKKILGSGDISQG